MKIKPMTQLEKLKKDISKITNPMEMAGYISGILIAAGSYCNENYPDEVIIENGKLEDITIYGICHYLESKQDSI